MSEYINKHKHYFTLLVLVLSLIPVFYINKTSDTDWGDDYVQYIYQSKHLFDTNYDYKTVINPLNHAPAKRGVLFSAFLSINQDIHNVLAYKNLICFSYFLVGLIVFLFFRQFFSDSECLLLTLCIVYNYRNLWLKDEIVAEYLFMAILYFIFYLEANKRQYPPLLYAFLFACLLSTRFVGIVFLIAFIIQHVSIKKKEINLSFIFKLLFWLFVFLIGIGNVFLKSQKHFETQFYLNVFLSHFNTQLIQDNFIRIGDGIFNYFEQELPPWFNWLLVYPALIFMLWGILIRFSKSWQFVDLCFLTYLVLLMVWENSDTINRYLIPVLPMLFFYIMIGLRQLLNHFKFNPETFSKFTGVYLLFILLSNFNTIRLFKGNSNLIGPLNNVLKNDFNAIKNNTPKNAVIAFNKPLVINLCCDRNSFALKENTQIEALKKADYFLLARNPQLKEIYEASKKTSVTNVDTIVLEHFYLLKIKQ